jgi:hypothetical protein
MHKGEEATSNEPPAFGQAQRPAQALCPSMVAPTVLISLRYTFMKVAHKLRPALVVCGMMT